MNETTIPSTKKEREYTVLHITPALRCFHCARLTSVLILDPAFINPEPLCPLHGYTSASDDESAEELQLRFESVKRYALWMHGCQGRISLVSPVADLGSIPGYDLDPDNDLPEFGFHVIYEDDKGSRQDMYVTWNEIDGQFYLFRDGVLIEYREQERVG